ncbi:MAG TPA: HAD-IIIA family hydrolase [Anaerohalosphaeraceae bacterium]|nr:HAD-IIIA family hydrolase [Anaerohalosphaeraceae bacterium]HOL87961.1 HAD-IIIA family hydrolase [Anaerohalosphaeraceae bacterium]HPP55460.1 HAD-IIIA family hydrolase [Anaerohalosphaeraceae bacterium]
MTQNKAVFLDRDQTLIEDPGYINHPSQVRLLPGVAQALIQLKKMGYLLVVVSNQSGVARGLVTEEVLQQIHHQLKKLLADEGAYLDAIYYCPFHPEGVIPKYRCESDLRKPNPGMLLKAAQDLSIDLSRSWMIGDSFRDIEAGIRAGCKTILIESPVRRLQPGPSDPVPDRKVASLREAANLIRMLEQSSKPVVPAAQTTPQTDPTTLYTPPTQKPEKEKPAPAPEPQPVSEPPRVQPQPVHAAVEETPSSDSQTPERSADEEREESNPLPEQAPSEEDILPQSAHPDIRSVLQEILRLVRLQHRERMYEDFSFPQMLAMMTGVLSVFCLILSIWFWFDSAKSPLPAQMTLGYAVALLLLTVVLLLIRK